MKMAATLLPSLSLVAASGILLAVSAPKSGPKINAKVASVYPPNSPLDPGLNELKEALAWQTGGGINFQIHRSSAMADE